MEFCHGIKQIFFSIFAKKIFGLNFAKKSAKFRGKSKSAEKYFKLWS